MKPIRIIPKIDVKGPNLVKGIHLEGLRVLGDPEEFANYYYLNGADELIYQDVVASLYGRNNLVEIVRRTSKNIFIPLTVGGGIRNLVDIKTILRAGADKVSINTQAIKSPDFIDKAVKEFGSSTIVIAIESIKHSNNEYFAYTDNGREISNKNVLDWAKEVEDRGAGEIIITSIDKDGTGDGYELDLTKKIFNAVNIPVVVHGGVSKFEHYIDVLNNYNISGLVSSSALHYSALINNKFINKNYNEGNKEFLNINNSYKNFNTHEIIDIKKYLKDKNFYIRL